MGSDGGHDPDLASVHRGADAGRGRRRNSASREARPRAAGRCVCTLSVTESAWPQGLRGAGTAQEACGGPGAGEVLPERSRWSPAERPGQETRVWNQMAQEGEQGGCGGGCLGLEPGGPGGRGCRPLPAAPRGPAARPAAHSLCSSRPAFSSQSPRLFGLGAQLSSLPGWPLCPRASRGPLPLALSPTSPPLRGLSRQPPLGGGSGPVWSELCSLVSCVPSSAGMRAPGEWLAGGGPWVGIGREPAPAWGPCGAEWAEHEARRSNKAPASPCCVTTGWPLHFSEPGSLSCTGAVTMPPSVGG